MTISDMAVRPISDTSDMASRTDMPGKSELSIGESSEQVQVVTTNEGAVDGELIRTPDSLKASISDERPGMLMLKKGLVPNSDVQYA